MVSKPYSSFLKTRTLNAIGRWSRRDKRLYSLKAPLTKEQPKEADVVIIGGGSLGCQTAYHLVKHGVRNVVLLEKNKLTSGTTWHTAGLLWQLRNSDVDNELIAHTKRIFTSLEEETGISTGWINNGGLFIANNKQRLDEYKKMQCLGKVTGQESMVLSPEETKELYPLINASDIYGALYSPGDGTVDPSGLCQALSRSASNGGALIFENTPVLDILSEEYSLSTRKVKGVQTSHGIIKTENVVNCSGAWANHISKMVGIQTPLIAMKHAYVTTDKIPGIEGVPNIRDHDLSIYLKLQGDALHIGGYEKNPVFWDDVEEDFAFGLFELDWDVFGIHLENALFRVPILENIGIKSTVCGPESFTPDHKPIMGEDPRVRGYFHGNGFNSGGMMLGGGCGSELAQWIIQGRPNLDMFSYDIRRFCPKTSLNVEWVKARSHEAYAKNYATVFSHDQPLSGRGMKKAPFHEALENSGCFFEERFGWERPGWYTGSQNPVKDYDWYGSYGYESHSEYKYALNLHKDYSFDFPANFDEIGRECLATRNSAALFDMSYFGKFYLTGPDARAAADWIFSQHIDASSSNKIFYTCMLNEKGKLEADLTVAPLESNGSGSKIDPILNEESGFYCVTSGASAYHNFAHILKAAQDAKYNVQILDVSQDIGILSIQGPFSREVLKNATPDMEHQWNDDLFPFSTQKIVNIGGVKVRSLRLSFVGELGWELHAPAQDCMKVYNIVKKAGEPFGLVNAGFRAMDSLSLEKGFPHWHQDIRSDDSPIEAGLTFTCKLKTNVNFLGREALEKEKESGVISKRKCCFTLDRSDVFLTGNEIIRRNGVIVGFIRRAEFGFHLGVPVAYGYVYRPKRGKVTLKWLKEGEYEIEFLGKRYAANYHAKTPFDPENLRVKGIYQLADKKTDLLLDKGLRATF